MGVRTSLIYMHGTINVVNR